MSVFDRVGVRLDIATRIEQMLDGDELLERFKSAKIALEIPCGQSDLGLCYGQPFDNYFVQAYEEACHQHMEMLLAATAVNLRAKAAQYKKSAQEHIDEMQAKLDALEETEGANVR